MNDETDRTQARRTPCGCLIGPSVFVIATAATLTAYVLLLSFARVVKVLPW